MKSKLFLVALALMLLPSLHAQAITPTNAYLQACTYASLDINQWIEINVLLILLTMTVGGFIYSASGLFPTVSREKVRGLAKVEIVQCFLSFFIIIALVGLSAATCQIGSQLSFGVTTYTDPIQYAQYYVGNLLFVKSADLFGQMYAESAVFVLWGNLLSELISVVEEPINQQLGLEFNNNAVGVYFGYAGILTGTYTGLMVVTFAILFVMWILLPFVEALGLTVVVPVALFMRAIPFTGPRLREAADSILSIAIAFYFILPLTFIMNSYIMTWLLCSNQLTGVAPPASMCNPFVNYTGHNTLQNFDLNTLFQENNVQVNGWFPASAGSPTYQLYGGTFAATGGVLGFLLNGLTTLGKMPGVINGFGVEIAQYLFEAIVLVALDIAITVGFAQGLTKGLSSMSNIMGFGPFWSSV